MTQFQKTYIKNLRALMFQAMHGNKIEANVPSIFYFKELLKKLTENKLRNYDTQLTFEIYAR